MRRSGKDVALVGYGQSVNECLAAAEMLDKVRTGLQAMQWPGSMLHLLQLQ